VDIERAAKTSLDTPVVVERASDDALPESDATAAIGPGASPDGPPPASESAFPRAVRSALRGLPGITPEGQVLAFLLMTACTMLVARPDALTYLALSIGLGTFVVGFAYPYQNTRRLALLRSIPRAAYAGEPVYVELAVANRRRGSASYALVLTDDGLATDHAGEIRVHVPAVPPGEVARAGYFACFPRRGVYRLRYTKLSSSFPFLLFSRLKVYRVTSQISVFPRPGRFRSLVLPTHAGSASRAAWRRGGGESFRGLREYREGEDARHIDWKTSMRRGAAHPLVRELDSEHGEVCAIALDPALDASPARLAQQDRALGCCVALARELLRRGYRVHFGCVDGTGHSQLTLGGRGGTALRPLLARLATYTSRGDARLDEVVARLRAGDRARALLVVVTGSGGAVDLARMWDRGPALRLDVESSEFRAMYDDRPSRTRTVEHA